MADPMTEVIPYDNPHLTVDDAVIQRFDLTLDCPDGEPSSFHMVYREDATEPAPVVILLHSGAFDYVLKPGEGGPLSGVHYRVDSRLERDFAVRKTWETLGLQIEDMDPAEENEGTLPAAFANRGAVQLIPGNCWGDLWHNEEGVVVNDLELDRFNRNGRTIATWMLRLLAEPAFAESQSVSWPVDIDGSQIFLVGLGEGGRGVLELLNLPGPTIRGAAVDSMPDNLDAFVSNPVDFQDEIDGLERLYVDLTDIGDSSFAGDVSLPERFYYLWSSSNPQLPLAASQPAASALRGKVGVVVENTGQAGHVLSNSDLEVAEAMVDFLLGSEEGTD